MVKSPKNAVYAKAKELGARVTWNELGRVFNIRVQAPAGFHWTDGAVHELVAVTVRPQKAVDRDVLWTDVLKRMAAGLQPCDPANQDCADNEESL